MLEVEHVSTAGRIYILDIVGIHEVDVGLLRLVFDIYGIDACRNVGIIRIVGHEVNLRPVVREEKFVAGCREKAVAGSGGIRNVGRCAREGCTSERCARGFHINADAVTCVPFRCSGAEVCRCIKHHLIAAFAIDCFDI